MNKIVQFKINWLKNRNLLSAMLVLSLILNVEHAIASENKAKTQINVQQIISQKRVTLNFTKQPIATILNAIKTQSKIGFIMNDKVIEQQLNSLSINVTNVTVDEALNTLLRNTPYSYRVVENVITIVRKVPTTQKQIARVLLSGRVLDEDSKPVVGATVVIAGSSNGAITDAEGKFKLVCLETDIILITYTGMHTVTLKVDKEKPEVVVNMKTSVVNVDDVIVIGYGTTTRKDLTGSVHHIDGELFEQSAASDIGHIIQGQVPGMYVLAGTGAPGAAVQMQIRGVSSLKGNVNPLIVVDKVPMPDSFDIGTLNPKDIQSIDVLTDASSAAIYGSRASAGVIIVTSRKGTSGNKARVSYSGSFGIEQLTSDINILSPEEFKLLLMEAVRNSAIENAVQNIEKYIGYQTIMAPGFFGESNTEWMKLLMRNASKQGHNFAVSGGAPASQYYLSLGYNKEIGQVRNASLDKYNLSLNLNNRLGKSVNMGLSIKGNYGDNDTNSESLSSAATARPDMPAFNPDGSYYIHKYTSNGRDEFLRNPLLEMMNENNRKDYGLYGSAFINIDILKNLNFRASYAMDYFGDKTRNYFSSESYAGSGGYKGTTKGQLSESISTTVKKEAEATLSYNKKIKKHFFDVV